MLDLDRDLNATLLSHLLPPARRSPRAAGSLPGFSTLPAPRPLSAPSSLPTPTPPPRPSTLGDHDDHGDDRDHGDHGDHGDAPEALPMLARERLWNFGTERVSDEELVGIVLGTGMRGRSVWSVAGDVVRSAGGLPALSRATPQELIHTAGIGTCRAVRVVAAFELGRRALFEQRKAQRICAPEDVARLLMPRLAGATQERFYVIGLDSRNQLIAEAEVARGALAEVLVYPREVFRPLIRMAASTAILAHNHPSGDPTPSGADLELTRRLREVGEVVGIPLMDHIVIAGHRYRSINEWAGTTL